MFFLLHGAGVRWAVEPQQHRIVLADGGVPRHDGVDLLLVDRPDLVPLHEVRGLRHALRHDELKQALDGHAAPQHALHGREPRVVPALHVTVVDEPGQLALGQDGVGELRLGELHELHLARLRGLQHPSVHLVAVLVLDGAERMGHSLDGVHARAGEVVGRVGLVGGARSMVRRLDLATVEHRVAQALVFALHVHPATDAALQALRAAGEHLLPQTQVLLHGVLAPGAFDARVALLPHLVHLGVVDVGLAFLDDSLHQLLQLGEVVRRVRHLVREDLECGEVGLDALLELVLLFARVGVVEAEEHLAVVVLRVVEVEHGRLGMANVEVAARLRREAGADLAHFSARQEALESRHILALAAGIA
mmetsp:Transcript_3780/g.10537  ORF Transcript_3780/g.10537 Transcript_3780/m.10537 type:complete len:363 (-) Transcript_3780:291-1379(-)